MSFSDWEHLDDETDTEETDDDHHVGGLGIFSHKATGLSHQHWIEQVLCNGGFNVGCTQAAEASHKTNMRLASQRVRHMRDNETTNKMREYLKHFILFENLSSIHESKKNSVRKTRTPRPGVYMKLNIYMGANLSWTTNQRKFLHRQIRFARVELMDLLCVELQVPKTIATYDSFNCLSWDFGQKLMMSDGTSYWATDTSYTAGGVSSPRRDVFLLRGSEQVLSMLSSSYRLLGRDRRLLT